MKKTLGFILLLVFSSFAMAQNQNLSNGNVFDGEPYLAVNPNNSQHLVVAWMGWVDIFNRFQIKTKVSFDGGQSWSTQVDLPHTISSYSSADPSLAFNQNGEVFLAFIDFTGTTPPVTGGVYLSKSTDGGLSWGTPSEVINTSYDGTKWPIDRPWMVIDRSTGATQGNIYITTMNLNRNNPSYRPYLSVSSDNGNTFTTTYVDGTGWLSGNLITTPMCSPTISSSGVFYGVYPSYLFSQNPNLQYVLATSTNAGSSFSYSNVYSSSVGSPFSNYPNAKKGGLLISNPADPDHLANIYLAGTHGDLDVFLIESKDAGLSWSSPHRVNDDPTGNNRMQDLIWGDFDDDGDLIVSWRDRRNGTDSTYETASEIWAAFRQKDSLNFEANFPITSQSVGYDSILESAGNDFMSVQLQDDTISAVWGDVASGYLNIWFNRMDVGGTLLFTRQLASESITKVSVYPNPVHSTLHIQSTAWESFTIFDVRGNLVHSEHNSKGLSDAEIDVSSFSPGIFFLEVMVAGDKSTHKIVIARD